MLIKSHKGESKLSMENKIQEVEGIRIGDIVEYRLGAREVIGLTDEKVLLKLGNESLLVHIEDINLLNVNR